MRPWLLFTLLLWLPVEAGNRQSCDGCSPTEARLNYMLQCQGCHLPSGQGLPGEVPSLQEMPGKFLQVAGGREFLVRVPGAINAPLDDVQLAATMNWILQGFSAATLPDDFVPYTAAEVTSIRKAGPLANVSHHRRSLLEKMDRLDDDAPRY